MTTFKLWI